jgi:uncharacterized membrane protein
MKIKLLIAALVLLIAINLGTLGSYVYIQFFKEKRPSPAEMFGRPPFAPGERPDLRLKKEQRKQLRNLLMEFGEETEILRTQVMELEQETFLLMQQTPVSMETVDQKLKEISDIRLTIMQRAVKKMINAKSFLSPAQQRHFFKAMTFSRPGMHKGRRPPGRRPPKPDSKQFMY